MRNWFRTSPFWIRLTNWEFWSVNITYIPVVFYYLFLCLKSRSFGFFAAVNPGIEYGGMRGESKCKLLQKLPQKYYPKTLFIPRNIPQENLFELIRKNDLDFPLIGKPDIGERGICVKKIDSKNELIKYHKAMYELDYMIQSYIPYEEEYAILHYRLPNEDQGKIISVCKKEFLKVVGDGKQTVRDLILDYPRAVLQLKRLEKKLGKKLNFIPFKDEVFPLGLIGNHNLGTEFMNHNHEIDEQLTKVFDVIEQSLEGVCFARYDLRCKSIEELKQGKHIYIVEINGTGSEAAHIYDSNMNFVDRYKAMFQLWHIMYKIAKINNKKGHPNMTLKDMLAWKNSMKEHYPKMDNVKFDF